MGGGAADGENEKLGWEGHTLMLEIASAFLVCVGWKAKVITAVCREIVVTLW